MDSIAVFVYQFTEIGGVNSQGTDSGDDKRQQADQHHVVPVGQPRSLAQDEIVDQWADCGTEVAPHVAPTENRADVASAHILFEGPVGGIAEINGK